MAGLNDGNGQRSGGHLMLAAAGGLTGAAGVALAAVAAHRIDSPTLVTAATMLMVHGAAALGLAGLAGVHPARGFAAAGGLMLAAVWLFSADVTVHAITGAHLFPYAAPTGGSLTILSWIVVALAATWAMRSR